MGTGKLTELFEAVAEDVTAPELAESAWSSARRARQRRRTVTVAAMAAVAVLGTVIAVAAPFGGTPSTPDPGRGLPGEIVIVPGSVDTMPSSIPRTAFRSTDGVLNLPDGVREPDGRARKLSQRPPGMAYLLYQKYPVDEGDALLRPVYALGVDGWTELDGLDLKYTRDASGNTFVPLRSTSLSPDRRLVAIPQPNELVVVDLGTGKATRTSAPGFHEHVFWRGTGTVLIGGDSGKFSVDVATRKVTPVPAELSLWHLVVDPLTSTGPVIEMPNVTTEFGDQAEFTLRQWDLQDREVGSVFATRQGLIENAELTEWNRYGWQNRPEGRYVVRAGWGRLGSVHGLEMVAIFDFRAGGVVRILDLGRDRWKGCCEPLGWVDDETVAIRTEKEGIVYWNVVTGDVRQVRAPRNGMLAMA